MRVGRVEVFLRIIATEGGCGVVEAGVGIEHHPVRVAVGGGLGGRRRVGAIHEAEAVEAAAAAVGSVMGCGGGGRICDGVRRTEQSLPLFPSSN
jgi:hypothetical protein